MFAWQFSKSLYTSELHGWSKFISMQDHYNLLYREEEREMHPLCADQGVGVIPWSPLARGRLTRDWDTETTRSQTDQFGSTLYDEGDKATVDAVSDLAEKRGVPRAQIALAWMLHKPVVTAPIIGAGKVGHVDDAVAALDVSLTDDEIATLEQHYRPRPIVGFS
jgi:aryl-alcohol dehydrogenase-like predicted oxidoreductase